MNNRLFQTSSMARKTGSVGARTARDIAQAAQALFARRGYAAVSMRDIAGAVGVQASALYNHFPTKQHILRDLMVGHLEALIAAWEAESRRFATPAAALEGFVRFHIAYHRDRRDAVFLAYNELRSLEPENFRAVERLRHYYEGCLRKIVSIGVRDGAFHVADPHVAAMAIIAMLAGLGSWFREGGRLGIGQVADIYVNMALGSVGAPAAVAA